MKLQIAAVLSLIIISSNLFAQDCSKKHVPYVPIDMKGKLGVYLQSNSDFSPNNIIGGNLGAKYFVTNKIAVRGGLTFSNTSFGLRHPEFREGFGQFGEFDNSNDFENGNGMDGRGRRGTSYATLGASAYAMYYPLYIGKFRLYAGAGGIYNFYTTPAHLNVNGITVSNIREQRVGFGALAGAEYNLLSKMNVTVEYNPTYLFKGKDTETTDPLTGQIIKVRGQRTINPSNVNLGVSYYFN